MKLPLLSRARVAVLRPLVRAIFASRPLRSRLARSRVGSGVDPDFAALLTLDDLTRDSDVSKSSPESARHQIIESAAIVEDPPRGGG